MALSPAVKSPRNGLRSLRADLGTPSTSARPSLSQSLAPAMHGAPGAGLATTANTAQPLRMEVLDIRTQVDRLIREAQSHANLCQLYWGWNPMW